MPILDDLQMTSALKDSDKPYVKYDTITPEDVARTKAEGVMRFKDVDRAIITSPGGKSNVILKMPAFWEWCKAESNSGRCKQEWVRSWEASYEAYKQGKELPVEGTPIRGWKLLSGAQQEELIRINVRSVEDLANLSDEGIRNIGMGAVDMKRRAKAWIEQNASHEASTLRLASIEKDNESLKAELQSLKDQLQAAKKDKK